MKTAAMKSVQSAKSVDSRTYSKEQRAIQKEFCDTYKFKPEQIGFDGNSLEPIFDYDALAVLSIKLCNLPVISVDFGTLDRLNGLATSRGIIELPSGASRKTFGSAMVGEQMPNGERIDDIHQAVTVSRARALRHVLRSVGFDPLIAHRAFVKTGAMLELTPVDPYLKQLAEIHLHAQSLDLISVSGDGFVNKVAYQQKMAGYFNGKTSARELTEEQRSQWLQILRAWTKANNVARNRAAAAQAV